MKQTKNVMFNFNVCNVNTKKKLKLYRKILESDRREFWLSSLVSCWTKSPPCLKCWRVHSHQTILPAQGKRLYENKLTEYNWLTDFKVKIMFNYPCFNAKRIKPLRFFNVRIIRLGTVSNTSMAPPGMSATTFPVPLRLHSNI